MPFSAAFVHSHVCSTTPPPNTRCSMGDLNNVGILYDVYMICLFQNIDCGCSLEPPRRGGSNKYLQSMFWNKNKNNMYTPAYPSFFFSIQKWGLRGFSYHGHVFLMWFDLS